MPEMTREQLQGLIKEVVQEAFGTQLKEVQEQQTNWMSKILSGLRPAETPAKEKGLMTARFVRALAAAKGNPERAGHYAKKQWNDDVVSKALLASNGAAGGFIVPTEYSTEMIELLQATAVMRKMGCRTLPMDTGTMQIPRQAGGATSAYIGESQNIPASEQTFGMLQMTWKKLACLVPISNDLLRFSNPSADAIVRDDMVTSMSLREDLAFIRGTGLQNTPRGLRNWVNAANVIPTVAVFNLATVTTDMATAIMRLKSANSKFIRPGWLLSPRSEMYLMSVRDVNGNFAFRAEMLQGKLWMMPYGVSNQIPENLGVGGNESEVYLVDFADCIIGESTNLIIDTSAEAAYFDGANVVAAFSLDQTVVRCIEQHDFVVRHDRNIAVLTAVFWTP